MKYRQLYLFTCLFIIVLTIGLLVSGSPILLYKIWAIPLGNLLTWGGMVSLPSSIYFAFPAMVKSKWLGRGLKFLILLSLLWLPISFLLSGNLSNSFTGENVFLGRIPASKIFWALSYGLPLSTVLLFFLYALTSLFKKVSKESSVEE